MKHRPKMKVRGLRRMYGNRRTQQLSRLPASLRATVIASRIASRELGLFVDVFVTFSAIASHASRSLVAAHALRADTTARHIEETQAFGEGIGADPALIADVIAQTSQHTAGTATDWAIARRNLSALAGSRI